MSVQSAIKPRAGGRPSFAWPRSSRVSAETAGVAAALVLLLALSLIVRARLLGLGYWIDEGLSVGIASHPLSQIPTVLHQDGSPPLYYSLLHIWIGAFGSKEVATHWLSMVFGLLCVPVALWAGWSLFGRRTGLYAAAVAAIDPFLNWYSAETRMYALLALLTLLGAAFFLHTFAFRRRRYAPALALVVVAMLYTHNWSAFFIAGAVAAGLVLLRFSDDRRGMLIDGAIVAGIALVAYAPWIPTLLSQIKHTGAPWTVAPNWRAFYLIPKALFGKPLTWIPFVLVAGAGLYLALRRSRREDIRTRALAALLVLAVVTVVSSWVASKITPAWAPRYFATFVGPVLLLVAVGLARARWVGLAAIVVVGAQWVFVSQPSVDAKSNARTVVTKVRPAIHPGDTVLSTWPEQVPVLHHYLPAGLHYATPLGPVADPTVMDWRDAMTRFERATPATTLEPVVARMPVGSRLIVFRPNLGKKGWTAPWTRLVSRRTYEWLAAIGADKRLKFVRQVPKPRWVTKIESRLRARVYVKVAAG